MRAVWALSFVLIAGCPADDSPDMSHTGPSTESGGPGTNPEVAEACNGLCIAQIDCGTSMLGPDDCTMACVADVGTPSTECATALTDLSSCQADNCDDTACADELAQRDLHCGATG